MQHYTFHQVPLPKERILFPKRQSLRSWNIPKLSKSRLPWEETESSVYLQLWKNETKLLWWFGLSKNPPVWIRYGEICIWLSNSFSAICFQIGNLEGGVWQAVRGGDHIGASPAGTRARLPGVMARGWDSGATGSGGRLWAGTPGLPFHETNRSVRGSVAWRHRGQTWPCALSGAVRSVSLTSESHTFRLCHWREGTQAAWGGH